MDLAYGPKVEVDRAGGSVFRLRSEQLWNTSEQGENWSTQRLEKVDLGPGPSCSLHQPSTWLAHDPNPPRGQMCEDRSAFGRPPEASLKEPEDNPMALKFKHAARMC